MRNTRASSKVGITPRPPIHYHKEERHSAEEDGEVEVDFEDTSDEENDPEGEKANEQAELRRRNNYEINPFAREGNRYAPPMTPYTTHVGWNPDLFPPPKTTCKPVLSTQPVKSTNWWTQFDVTYKWIILMACVIFIVGSLIFLGTNTDEEIPMKPTYSENDFTQFKENIISIKKDFPSQLSDIWSAFLSGIRKVLLKQPQEPSIFLLLQHGEDSTSSCLARKVGRAAQNTFNASDSTPVFLDGGDSKIRTYDGGEFTTHFGPLVHQHRIFVITNLHSMPATVSASLHSFCDTVTPLVHEAVYIFTVTVDKPWREGESGTKVAEQVLDEAWKELDQDTRQALIIRVTSGQVLKIQHEEGLTGCTIS